MGYLVFARKWRPQNFDEVIGQEHIATTLKNALSLNRVAHAYLFSGPRGIGKTSTARILAKALNCQKGSTPSPCNKCENCLEISEGRSLDVLEIDGASNRGIEQIRQLRENVKFAPAKSRFKIYIIDEVHQITTDGFNALLKTLEEPPAHVKFIFATTEVHKVLPTILSRCQRFDFKPLPISLIMEKLKKIVEAEKLNITEEALLYIARSAASSMRDAESILDQLSSFCQDEIKLETVTSVLGMINLEVLAGIAQKIIERSTTEALKLVESIINEGKDLPQFIAGLMEYFRHILLTKIVPLENAYPLIDLPKDDVRRIVEQGKSLALGEIFYIFNVLVRAQESLRRTLSSRVIVEMAIVRLTQRENLSSLENILQRLEKLEQNLTEPNLPKSNPKEDEGGKHAKGDFAAGPRQIKLSNEDYPQGEANNNDANALTQNEVLSFRPKPVATAVSTSEELNQNWFNLLQAIKEEKMFVASFLEFGKIAGLKDNVLTIAFAEEHNFYKENLERTENKKLIETKAKEVFQSDLKLRFILDKNLSAENQVEKLKSEDPQNKPSTETIIQAALNIFQGRIVKHSGE